MTRHISGTKWTPEQIQEIINMRDQGLSWHDIGEAFGVSSEAVRLAKRKSSFGSPLKGSVKIGEDWVEDSKGGTASLDIISKKFLDIEDALKKCNVDQKKWEITSFKRSCWTTPIAARVHLGKIIRDEKLVKNYSIKIHFKRKTPKPIETALKDIIANIPTFKYVKSAPKFTVSTGVALEVAPVDAHFAKLAWSQETGRKDYDLDIAVKDYNYVIEQNLAWGSIFRPEKIFFIFRALYILLCC